MDKEEIKEIKKLANSIKPKFNLGKAGLTETFTETIDKYLEAHHIVKIKVTCAGTKDEVKYFADTIADATESQVLDKKGFTFVLFRE